LHDVDGRPIQVDRFGNLNTTAIASYAKPKVRLPGSGGACEIAIHARRLFYIMRLSRRAFVAKLDFLTSPGFLRGGEDRDRLRMPGGGPQLVVTDKALFDFGGPDHEMRLASLYPGITFEEVSSEVGWPLRMADRLSETPRPTAAELECIRRELDPAGMYRN
jgi:glutaconate CoA-transferase subunit B